MIICNTNPQSCRRRESTKKRLPEEKKKKKKEEEEEEEEEERLTLKEAYEKGSESLYHISYII